MGCSPFKKSCYTNSSAVAPNPSPDKWELMELYEASNGYVMKVKYEGCTNCEGEKIMVFRGQYKERSYLDPHFSFNGLSPMARFIPTDYGMKMAKDLADSFGN